jgi:hypothetical protein
MSLPEWMGWLEKQGLLRGSKRHQARPCLEVLEDRLTPSGDVLALNTSNLSQSSNSQYGAFINSLGNPLSPLLSIPPGTSGVGGKPTLTASGSSLNGAGNSAMQQEITVQLVDGLGNLVTALHSLLVQAIGPSGTGPAGSSSASFAISSSGSGTLTLTATQQELIQGLSSLVFTTSPLTPTAGQNSQPVTLQLSDNNGNPTAAPSDGVILYLASNSSHQGSSRMEFVDANSDHHPTA